METKKRKKVMVACCICCGLVALITIGAAVTKQNKSKCKADETLDSEVLSSCSSSCSDTTNETEITSESITEAVSVRIQDTLKDTSSNNETGEKESSPNNISKMKTTTVKTEKTTASNASVTTAATTKREIPCGSNQDINPEQLKAEANKHLGSFSNVEVSSTLNKNNSCWTLTVNSFNNQKDIKECAEIEYNECVNAGYLNRGAPIKMYVDYEAKARDDLGSGVCYYTFYIFYL